MVRLYRRYEDKDYRTEAKQVGTLYHVCTLDAFVNRIIEDKELGTKDNLHASGKYHNSLLDTYDAVSFTRDSLFVVPTWTVQGADILFQFVIDGDKLSEHYKITPYNGNYRLIDGEKHLDNKMLEKEEVVIGPIKDFKSYIKEVRFDIKTLRCDLISYKDDIEEVKKYLGSISCKRKELPILKDDWTHDYKKTSKEYELYKIKTLDDLLKYIEILEEERHQLNRADSIREYIDTQSLFNKYLISGLFTEEQVNELIEAHPEWLSGETIISLFNNYNLPETHIKKILNMCLNKLNKSVKNHLLAEFCYKNNPEIVKILLDSGAVPTDELFLKVCEWNNTEVAKILIDYVKDINVKDYYNVYLTPLYYAVVQNENHELAELLLDKGAELSYAILLKEVLLMDNPLGKMFDIILSKGHLSDELLIDTAFACIGSNNIAYLKKLINKGLDKKSLFEKLKEKGLPSGCKSRMLNYLLDNGYGAYMYDIEDALIESIKKNNIDTIKLLLESYPDKEKLKQVLNSGKYSTPLEYAVKSGNIEIIELLLNYGAEPKSSKDSILTWADKGDTDILNILIKHGAVVDVMALNRFIAYDDLNSVELLLKNGGSNIVNTKSNASPRQYPLEVALASSKDMIKLLLEHGANPNVLLEDKWYSPLYNIITGRKNDIVKLLLDYGLNPNATVNGSPLLEQAIVKRDTELMKYLLEKGANPNEKTDSEFTMLDYACNEEIPEMVELLIKHGADINKIADALSPEMEKIIDKYKRSNKKEESLHIKRLYRR